MSIFSRPGPELIQFQKRLRNESERDSNKATNIIALIRDVQSTEEEAIKKYSVVSDKSDFPHNMRGKAAVQVCINYATNKLLLEQP